MKRLWMYIGVLLLLAVLLWACSSVNKLQRKEKRELQRTTLTNRTETQSLSSKQSILFTDSSQLYRLVEIYPLGVFVYSAATGFIGKAAKVEMKTYEQKAEVLEANLIVEGTSSVDEMTSEEVEVLEVKKERAKEKEVMMGGFWWWVVIGILSLCLVLLIKRVNYLKKILR